MATGAWLEIVHQPHRLELAGRPLPAFTPFGVPPGRVTFIGGFGQPLGVDVAAGVVTLPADGRAVAPGGLLSLGSIGLRVLSSPLQTSAWPSDVARPLTADDETLRVVADLLLERGYALGHRVLARSADDGSWLGPFGVDEVTGWRLGLVDELRLSRLPSRWAAAVALRNLAIFGVVRSLVFAVEWVFEVRAFLEALIAQGGLPFLERLEVVAKLDHAQAAQLDRLVLDGRAAAFPRLGDLRLRTGG
ncbi:MAG: hypothetical protein INH41_18500 [Myxococcaceae bacterium]|jgi:hypothetical protein|nr:hypothetical protein [Myxococcaceae bacterium]MCA3014378.1 hypothetical protein [Myxococcaceae bacterium]